MKSKSIVVAVTHEISAQAFYRGYLAYLKKKGWDVTLVTSSSGGLQEFANSEGVKAVNIPMRREPAPIQDLVSLWRWIRVLRKLQPSIVVAATPKASLLGMIAAKLTRVPIRVYQMWGLRFETESGLRRILLRSIERATAYSATCVISNSSSLAEAAVRESVLGKKVPTVLGAGSSHGVDLEYFSIQAETPQVQSETKNFIDSHKSEKLVGFVGRIHEDKGLDTLLSAIEICQDRGARIAFVVVGGNENDALMKTLLDAQNRYPLHVVGALQDPRGVMALFDVLCLPSRREGFPNVVLETAAMGIPAVVSDATGTIDSVVNGLTGLIFETGNADQLAGALIRIAHDDDLRETLGRSARTRAEELFSKERMWDLQESELEDFLLKLRAEALAD